MRILVFFFGLFLACQASQNHDVSSLIVSSTIVLDSNLLVHEIDLTNNDLRFYYKDEFGKNFGSLGNLKNWLDGNNKELTFAVNGGMYKKDYSPQGLYIENGNLLSPLDTQLNGFGNFYLQPNGILGIGEYSKAIITETNQLKNIAALRYATQSGPMLVINGKMHPGFRKGSSNLNIRNGVGILPNGNLLFVMSKQKINFYDLADFFLKNDCKNALYLDGFVSRTYWPKGNWKQLDGNFGVIIGVSKAN